MKKFILIAFFAFIAIFFTVMSRPQYSLLQSFGTKCTSCHINTQGGGVRSAGGWVSRKDISLIPTSFLGLNKFFDQLSTNSWANELITTGMDVRLQEAKWGVPLVSTRSFMLMQSTPYLVFKPSNWLTFEGQYNISYNIYTDKRYTGQNPWAGSVYLKASDSLPTLRAGYFQPTFGIKWDDHTVLTRQFYGIRRGNPIIPDDFTEWGAQIDYESISWLSASVGVFSSKNMSKIPVKDANGNNIPIVDSTKPAISMRGFLTPPIGMGFVGFIGGTYYLSGDYYIGNWNLGFGKPDKFSLLFEYMDTEKKNVRRTQGLAIDLTYQLVESVLPYIRAEREITREKVNRDLYYTTQWVFGSHIYLLPFMDILPEYRIIKEDHLAGYSAEWTFQLHVWY